MEQKERSSGILTFECNADAFDTNVVHFWERYDTFVSMNNFHASPEYTKFLDEVRSTQQRFGGTGRMRQWRECMKASDIGWRGQTNIRQVKETEHGNWCTLNLNGRGVARNQVGEGELLCMSSLACVSHGPMLGCERYVATGVGPMSWRRPFTTSAPTPLAS